MVSVSTLGAAQGPLGSKEAELIKAATYARRREFTAGRVLARRALDEMGFDKAEIVQGPSGAPLWPAGICGSIAHNSTHAAIAVAPVTQILSVGIDIDDGRNLEAATEDVASKVELLQLAAHPLILDDAGAARLVFCAKEALYKCQAPITGNSDLGFADVELDLQNSCLLRAKPVINLDSPTFSVVGSIKILVEQYQGVTIAIAWLPVANFSV